MDRRFFPLFFLLSIHLHGQTNVRGWYADGQVWITWDIQLPLSETVGVYTSPDPFTNTNAATLIGRPFHLDYLPSALIEQVDSSATYRIPDGQGGTYQLAPNEGLFVYTPHQVGSQFFAVAPWGETDITVDQIVPVVMELDPVQCHLQAVFPSPFANGFICLAYYMWVDGRQNHWEGRPGFPVMANAAKNGMAGFFLISVPVDLDTSQLFPLSVWLHGGGGTARQSLAGSRPEVNIRPRDGILLAHNDDVYGRRGDTPAYIDNPSRHFGWRKNWNPFTSDNFPTEVDTVINYTQRRYLWIDTWLMRRFNIDPYRIHIHGHSMGSSGTTALVKAYANHYASAVIFNNGFRGHEGEGNTAAMFGPADQNYPTNLRKRNGEIVPMEGLTDLSTPISVHRDLPVIKSYHSKNDTGNHNQWGVEVIDQYNWADASGHGIALFWSERGHGMDTGPDWMDHWISGFAPDAQTETDNVAWGEKHYRSDQSYPAFFNHRLDPNAHDPGDGTIGTGVNGIGDDWGTWGGWHRWDAGTLIDEAGIWSVMAWLESEAVYGNDNCPYTLLTADMAIRRAIHFTPKTGDMVRWEAKEELTGNILQSGISTVGPDDLVLLDDVVLYPENVRRTIITVVKEIVSTNDLQPSSEIRVFPNPARNEVTLGFESKTAGEGNIRITSMEGRSINEYTVQIQEGLNNIQLPVQHDLPMGIYMVGFNMDQIMRQVKLIVQ